MKNTIFTLLLLSLVSCGVTQLPKSPTYQLNLLDEYIIPHLATFDEEQIGGLSGIDFQNDTLALIDDRSNKPIVYMAKFETSNQQIDSLIFVNSMNLKKTDMQFQNKALDMESIRFGKNGDFWITSEGNINKQKNPIVFQINKEGELIKEVDLPSYFQVNENNQPRHNAVFEGMTWDNQKQFIWVATELPLVEDGKKPQLWNSFSPVRFTKFNPQTGKAEQQFMYRLDRIVRLPYLPFYINGITEILNFSENEFLVLERSYSAGRGKRANSVKLFVTNPTNASNTLNTNQIKRKDKHQPAKKYLLLNFKKIRKQLTSKRIDNIEGLCYGPKLANGNTTLLFVSDNNFNAFGEQITQLIWMELIEL